MSNRNLGKFSQIIQCLLLEEKEHQVRRHICYRWPFTLAASLMMQNSRFVASGQGKSAGNMKTSETLSLISHFFIKHLFTEVFLQGQTIQERKERERERKKKQESKNYSYPVKRSLMTSHTSLIILQNLKISVCERTFMFCVLWISTHQDSDVLQYKSS